MNADSPAGLGWTLVLRRQPARIVQGRPEGGYTNVFEIICCRCGDDPDRDYHEDAQCSVVTPPGGIP